MSKTRKSHPSGLRLRRIPPALTRGIAQTTCYTQSMRYASWGGGTPLALAGATRNLSQGYATLPGYHFAPTTEHARRSTHAVPRTHGGDDWLNATAPTNAQLCQTRTAIGRNMVQEVTRSCCCGRACNQVSDHAHLRNQGMLCGLTRPPVYLVVFALYCGVGANSACQTPPPDEANGGPLRSGVHACKVWT